MTAYAPSMAKGSGLVRAQQLDRFQLSSFRYQDLGHHIRDRQKILPHAADGIVFEAHIGANPEHQVSAGRTAEYPVNPAGSGQAKRHRRVCPQVANHGREHLSGAKSRGWRRIGLPNFPPRTRPVLARID